MSKNNKIQFVIFETSLDAEPFFERWKEYKRSRNSDVDVTIQQSRYKKSFRYIAQHKISGDEIQFVFARGRSKTSGPQKSIRLNLAGGYTLLQSDRLNGAGANESKVIAFITDAQADLPVFKELAAGCKLNIYEPYYHNCKFEYILEYFIKKDKADVLVEQLQSLEAVDVAVYEEFKTVNNVSEPKKEEELHVWPSF